MGASQVRHCRGRESNEIFTKPLDEGGVAWNGRKCVGGSGQKRSSVGNWVGGGGGETGKEMARGEFVGEGVDGGEEWVEGKGGAQGGGAEEEEGTGKGKGKEMKKADQREQEEETLDRKKQLYVRRYVSSGAWDGLCWEGK